MKTYNHRGRPTLHSKKLEDKICELLAYGYSLRRISKRKGMPSKTTIMNWLRQDPYFIDQYAHAKLFAYNTIREEQEPYIESSLWGTRAEKHKARKAMFNINKRARNLLPRANTPDRVLRLNYGNEVRKVMLLHNGEYTLNNGDRLTVNLPSRRAASHKPCVHLLER